MDLLQTLVKDVYLFAKNIDAPLMNERDLQVCLAMHLKSSEAGYDDVQVEYAVPICELGYKKQPKGKSLKVTELQTHKNFPWRNDIYVDLTVMKNGYYAVVELKYATRELPTELRESTRFGSEMDSHTSLIKNQGAVDIVSYNYCKDIRRIEALVNRYPMLAGGVAMIISNNHLFWERPKHQETAHSLFALYEGHCIREVSWQKISQNVIDRHPPFTLDHTYRCTWEDTAYNAADNFVLNRATGSKFRFMINTISK